MIPLARRYCAGALAGLAIAVLAVALHRATAARFDPCADPAQLAHLDAFGAQYSVRDDAGGEPATPSAAGGRGSCLPSFRRGVPCRSASSGWTRRIGSFSSLGKIVLQPALPEDRKELRALRVGPDVLPVHRVFGGAAGPVPRIARYFFVHGARPVAHPLPSGWKTLWDQLVRGTEPVSLFMVAGVARPAAASALDDRADDWLAAAWTDYRRACRS